MEYWKEDVQKGVGTFTINHPDLNNIKTLERRMYVECSFSGEYSSVREFKILNHYVGQDDRRFRKMGYTGMIRLLIKSYVNRRNPNFFRQDVGYW